MQPPTPIRLRAHHLLCVFGFRGLGYSAEFVANMRAVVDAFFSEQGVEVEVVTGCDDICRACPHARNGECAAPEGSEAGVRVKDRLVLSKLGLSAGRRRSSLNLASAVAGAISASDLEVICGGCQWLPAGYCREGLARARQESRGGM